MPIIVKPDFEFLDPLGLLKSSPGESDTGEAMADVRPAAKARGAQGTGRIPSKQDIATRIAERAREYGIDPNYALRVAEAEGLNGDPAEAWQSKVVKNGVRERSYGPFQLYMGGGLGNEFKRQTGLDPSDPSTVYDQIDFALKYASENGWGSWYGAANNGIGDWDGIRNGKRSTGKATTVDYRYKPKDPMGLYSGGENPVKEAVGLGVSKERLPKPEERPLRTSVLRPLDITQGEYVDNGDGTLSTERTVTIQDQNGQWMNVPTLYTGEGQVVDLADNEEAIRATIANLEANGTNFERFASEKAAVAAAQARSEAKDRYRLMTPEEFETWKKAGQPPEQGVFINEVGKGLGAGAVNMMGSAIKGGSAQVGIVANDARNVPNRSPAEETALAGLVSDLKRIPDMSHEEWVAFQKSAVQDIRGGKELGILPLARQIRDGTMTAEEATSRLDLDAMLPGGDPVAMPDPRDSAVYQFGESWQRWAGENLAAAKDYEDSWTRKISEGLGSTVPFLATAPLTGGTSLVAGAALGSFASTGEAIDRAIEAGATKEQIIAAARLGRFPGLTEQLPIEVLFERVPLPVAGKLATALGKVLTQAAVEGGQEAVQQVAQNLIAKYTYKPDQEITEGVAEAAAIGGIVGGGLSAGVQGGKAVIDRRRGEQQTADATPAPEAAEPKAQVEPEPAAAPEPVAEMPPPPGQKPDQPPRGALGRASQVGSESAAAAAGRVAAERGIELGTTVRVDLDGIDTFMGTVDSFADGEAVVHDSSTGEIFQIPFDNLTPLAEPRGTTPQSAAPEEQSTLDRFIEPETEPETAAAPKETPRAGDYGDDVQSRVGQVLKLHDELRALDPADPRAIEVINEIDNLQVELSDLGDGNIVSEPDDIWMKRKKVFDAESAADTGTTPTPKPAIAPQPAEDTGEDESPVKPLSPPQEVAPPPAVKEADDAPVPETEPAAPAPEAAGASAAAPAAATGSTVRRVEDEDVSFPDADHADLYDYGDRIRRLRTSNMPRETVAEQTADMRLDIARRLQIPESQVAPIANDYVSRARRAARHNQPIPALNAKLLERKRAEGGITAPQKVDLDQAANEAATSPLNDLPAPTDAQKEAENYRLGHVRLGGMEISIENPAGSTRSGTSPDGSTWSNTMQGHYGRFKGTVGADGDHIDTFIKPGTNEIDDYAPVWVIDQIDPNTGAFDEHKIMLGYDSREEAEAAYMGSYDADWKGLGAISRSNVADLKKFFLGPTDRPYSDRLPQRDRKTRNIQEPKRSAPETKTRSEEKVVDETARPTPAAEPVAMEQTEKARNTKNIPSTDPAIPNGYELTLIRRASGDEAREAGFKPGEPHKAVIRSNKPYGVHDAIAATRAEAIASALEKAKRYVEKTTKAPAPAPETPSSTNPSAIAKSPKQTGAAAKSVAKFLNDAGLLEAVTQGESFYRRVENSPFMDLVIERLPHDDGSGRPMLSFAHYLEQNGDLINDGEMTWTVNDDGTLTLYDTIPAGRVRGAQDPVADQTFARMFAKNINDQGFAEAVNAGYKQAGADAFAAGAKRQVPRDVILSGDKKAADAWLSGWDQANLSAPVGEPEFDRAPPGENSEQTFTATKPQENASRFAGNKIFTEDKVEAARKRLKSKMSQLNSGIDPEVLIDGMTIAGAYIESGVRDFAKFAKSMTDDFGDGVRPYLLSFWEGARNYPGLETAGMTSSEDSARIHAELAGDLPASEAAALGGEVAKPTKRTKKRGRPEDRTITQDWGVEHIDAYSEEGEQVKAEFMKDAMSYLRAVADILAEAGLQPTTARNGKQMKPVSKNESGIATSGDISLHMQDPESGLFAYAHIGGGSLRGVVPSTPSGVQIMYRFGEREYATGGMNNWAPTTLTAGELAAKLLDAVAGKRPDYARPPMEGADVPEQLEEPGARTLEGAPPEEVRAPAKDGQARGSADRGGEPDLFAGDGARGRGDDARGGVGDGTRGSPDPATRGAERDGDVSERPSDDGSDSGSEPRPQGDGGSRLPDTGPAERLGADTGPGTETGGASTPAQNRPSEFTITDDDAIGEGGAKTKFRANVAAIRLLRTLEDEGRPATRDEQKTLAKWVGWGGLRNAFPREDGSVADAWKKEAAELRELLTDAEYRAAESSTRNAHYTAPEVVKAMWGAVERLGFTGGRVLEPSVGAGNFLGLMPADRRKTSQITGVELEHITGGIAKHLYPKASIRAPMGFQDITIPDNTFDLVIGNPPFGSERLYDGERRHLNKFSIHNYFFAKSIDVAKPDGVVAMVVSNFLMDAQSAKAREYLADRADLLGAIRLPNDAFLKNAGTEVTTDILFLRKRGENDTPGDRSWTEIGEFTDENGNTVALNRYFIANPDMMLGKFGAYGEMYRGDMTALVSREGDNLPALLRDAIAKLPAGIMQPVSGAPIIEASAPKEAADALVGSAFMDESGEVWVREPDLIGEPQASVVEYPNEKAKKRAQGMIRVRDAFTRLRRAQISETSTDAQLDDLRGRLNKFYDAFVKTHGPINHDANKRIMRDDPTWPQLSALEKSYDRGISRTIAKKTGETARAPSAEKADIFTRRTQTPYRRPTSAKSAKDALATVLSERGTVDMGEIIRLYGRSQAEIVDELGDLLFWTPGGGFETRDAYLSGNVKKKLAEAREAAAKDPTFARNVTALEDVIPADIEPVDIDVKPGSPWIPPKHIADFINHISDAEGARAVYSRMNAKWDLTLPRSSEAADTQWSTGRTTVGQVVKAALDGSTITVYDRDPDGKSTVNPTETQAANDKVERVKAEWRRWLWQDDARREELSGIYNDVFNTDVQRAFDGSHLALPGKVSDDVVSLRPHQKNFVWRVLQSSTTLADHTVGAGKTFAAISAAMELRRTGMAQKPLFVVPNHLVGQWSADFIKLYPGARILATTKRDFEKENRKRLFARMATGDYDAIVVAHSSFGKIGLDPEFEADFIRRQIADLEDSMKALRAESGERSRNVSQLAKWRENMESKLKRLLDAGAKDDGLTFNEIGIDALFVDEAHEFKNLAFPTSMTRVAGLGNPQGSQKAADLYMKVQSVKQRTGGRNIVFLTGTPISNTMAEMYTVQRYLDGDTLEQMGIAHFDAWAKVFGEVVTDWELSPSGQYKLNSRFAKFVNIPELMQRYLSFGDVITNDDIQAMLAAQGKRLPLPKVKSGKPQNIVVERSKDQAAFIGEPTERDGVQEYPKGSLVWRAENLPKTPEKGADNMLKVMSDARKAALDMRLIDPHYGDNPKSKVNRAADEMVRIYKKWSAKRGTQLVFIDLSTPAGARAKEADRIRTLLSRAEEGDEAAQEAIDKMSPDELAALDGTFSVYDDLRQKLIERGVPPEEIAFIHDANTDLQKEELFGKVRSGRVRFLFGSTPKMGAGTNVQNRLVALHHLDAPWRPSDLEQREGRIIRQGNELYAEDPDNFEVEILRYATKQTLDSRMWQTIEGKARFIQQLRKGAAGERVIEDIGGEAANAAEMKAASSGNPLILEEMDLRQKVRRMENQRMEHEREQHRVVASIRGLQRTVESIEASMPAWERDAKSAEAAIDIPATIAGKEVFKAGEIGKLILSEVRGIGTEPIDLGTWGDFRLAAEGSTDVRFPDGFQVTLDGAQPNAVYIDSLKEADPTGLGQRMKNTLRRIAERPVERRAQLQEAQRQIPNLNKQIGPFPDEQALEDARQRHRDVIDQLKPKKREQPNPEESAQELPEGADPTTPDGWAVADGMPATRLTKDDRAELERIVKTVSGLESLTYVGTIPLPNGAPGWGSTGPTTAAGYYHPVDDAITLALDTATPRAAYHESFHRLQYLFLTDAERALLKREVGKLRRIVGSALGRENSAMRMTQKELEAEAFAIYAAGKARSKPYKTIRAAWDRIANLIERVRNFLNGRGFMTLTDVFEEARTGRASLRTARAPDGGVAYSPPSPIFYSSVAKAVAGFKQDKATADQWLGMLRKAPGVKPEEIEWLGLEEWLRSQRGGIERTRIAEFIAANEITVGETVLADNEDLDDEAVRSWHDVSADVWYNQMTESQRDEFRDEYRAEELARDDGNTKYPFETMPGGSQYRELLLRLPAKSPITISGRIEPTAEADADSILTDFSAEGMESLDYGRYEDADGNEAIELRNFNPHDWQRAQEIADVNGARLVESRRTGSDETYRSGHWSQPNVLAHIRFNERFTTDAETATQAAARKARAEAQAKADEINARMVKAMKAAQAERAPIVEKRKAEALERAKTGEISLAEASRLIQDAGFKPPIPDGPAQKRLAKIMSEREAFQASLPKEPRNSPKRTLFIEEIQSDWHQTGRKKGYQGVGTPIDTTGFTVEKTTHYGEPYWRVLDADGAHFFAIPRKEGQSEQQAIVAAEQQKRRQDSMGGVPNAPFKTTWPELTFKRALRWAVDNGYDRVAWTPGEVQVDRYDLGHRLSSIHYEHDPELGWKIDAYDWEGEPVPGLGVYKTEAELAAVVGKDLAEKIVKGEGRKHKNYNPESWPVMILSGLDLRIGGEGMRSFYDSILPKTVGKLVKKWGGKVSSTTLQHDRPARGGKTATENVEVWSLDITDQMRESVSEGLPLFSLPDAMTFDDGPVTENRIIGMLKGKLTDLKPAMLSAIPLNYFTELARPNMTAVQDYMRVKRQMDAFRGDRHADANDLSQEWLDYIRRGKTEDGSTYAADIAKLMHDSTLAGIDPSVARGRDVDEGRYDTLRARYDAMPEAGRKLYRDVRDAYAKQQEMLDKILLDNVRKAYLIAEKRAEEQFNREIDAIEKNRRMDGKTKAAEKQMAKDRYQAARTKAQWSMKARLTRLRIAFESSRVQPPYFPLARFGRYYVMVRDIDGEVISFSKRESAYDRDRLAKDMRKAFPNASVDVGVMEEGQSVRDAMDPRIVAEIEQIVGGAGIDADTMAEVLDQIWQRYLETMPDLSIRKRFIHRKGTPGYDQDALRTFSSHMFHAAHQMARLKYGMELQELTNDVATQAKEADDPTAAVTLSNELRKRHAWVMNPTGGTVAQTMNTAAFVWYLGTTPAAALVNLSQTPMLGIPILGAKFRSMPKAIAALLRASKDSVAGRGLPSNSNLSAEEKKAMEAFYESGMIDRTQSHDLAGVGDVGVRYSPVRARVMEKISFLFHRAEVWNREVTALAAYRLARADNQSFEQAVTTAHDLTYKTHFDYSNSSRPRLMQNDFAKAILVFRAHNINMLYRLFRDAQQSFGGETPAARREARAQLTGIVAMQALMAGTAGIAGFNLAMAIAGMVFGDDDDPFDFEVHFRDDVIDLLGPELGGIVLNGVPGHYAGISLTNRIGMPDLWFRSPNRDLEGKDEFDYWVLNSLGASVSMLGEGYRGFSLVREGEIVKGIEALVPKFARDAMRAWRYANEGVTDYRGNEVVPAENLDVMDIAMQAAGFTPAKVTEAWERNSALKNAEGRILDKRQKLIAAYAMAHKLKDADAKRDALARIKAFNQVDINKPLKITPDTLRRSIRVRARNAKKREDGTLIQNRRLGRDLREQLPERVY